MPILAFSNLSFFAPPQTHHSQVLTLPPPLQLLVRVTEDLCSPLLSAHLQNYQQHLTVNGSVILKTLVFTWLPVCLTDLVFPQSNRLLILKVFCSCLLCSPVSEIGVFQGSIFGALLSLIYPFFIKWQL